MDKKSDWEYHPEWIDVIKLNLIDPVKPGETVMIETPFFVKIPKVLFTTWSFWKTL